jgi:heat shock protein HslJ
MLCRIGLVGAFALAAVAAVANSDRLGAADWRVMEIAGQAVPAEAQVTMSFREGRIAGRSACNRYTSGATIGDGTIAVGAVAGTRMACPPLLMEIETRFLAVLQQAERWTLDRSGRLTVTAKDGRTIVASR